MSQRSLEQIIKTRRTVRKFSEEMPDEQDIKDIAASAVYAPYGGATGIPLSELRKVFIFKRGTQGMKEAERLIIGNAKKGSKIFSLFLTVCPFMKKKMGSFASRLKMISEKGIPALKEAGYFIVIAEKKGFPPVEKQSLACALENMWLMATEKGFGFQIVSAAGQMAGNKEFLKLLGLKKGEFALEACAVGYPSGNIKAKEKSFDIEKFMIWIK